MPALYDIVSTGEDVVATFSIIFSRDAPMDKTVKRVTVLEGDRQNRQAKVVYDDPKTLDESKLPPIERAVRHVVNAALITAQIAYDSYLKRASEGKTSWLFQPNPEDTASTNISVETTIDDDETLPGTRI
jgi:hypothetical protein